MSAKPVPETTKAGPVPKVPRQPPTVPDPFKDRDAPGLDPYTQLKGDGS